MGVPNVFAGFFNKGKWTSMVQNTPINLNDQPEINPTYMFRWEEQEQAYLMLYPEGIIKLNDSAGNILKLCSGERTLEKIIEELQQSFGVADLKDDVYGFMEVALGKGWIRIKN